MVRPSRAAGRLACASVAAALLAAAPARAQDTRFELNPDGTWTRVAEPAPGSDEELLVRARRLLADRYPATAKAILTEWIEAHAHEDHPLMPEALLLRGDARVAAGSEYKALYDYEEIIKLYPGSEQFVIALERELEIGIRYLSGLRRKFLGLRIDPANSTGEELLVRVQERLPGSRLAERAGLELANYYYRRSEMRQAAEAYEIFLVNFPGSEHRKFAMERRIKANIARFKGPRYDATGLIEARLLTEEFIELYPADAERAGLNDALLPWLDEAAASQVLESARWYFRRGDFPAARFTLRRLLRKHGGTAAATEALRIMHERGWIEPTPTPPTPPDTAPSDTPADTATPPGSTP